MRRQHDDHCILSTGGRNYTIVWMRGMGDLMLRALDDHRIVIRVDLSDLRIDTYAAEALAMMPEDLKPLEGS